MAQREEKGDAQEGKGKEEIIKTKNFIEDFEKLLATILRSEDFNEERVAIAKDFVQAIEKSTKAAANAFHELSSEFQKDRADTKKIIKKYKQSIGDQNTIRQQAEERVETLGKAPINQKDPYATDIIRFSNEIQPIEQAILAEENQDREQLQELMTIAETRENKSRTIERNIKNIKNLLKKKPILPETIAIRTQVEEIKIALDDILTETQAMESLLKRRKELSQGIINLEGKLGDLIEQQIRQIQASEAHLAELQRRGAAA